MRRSRKPLSVVRRIESSNLSPSASSSRNPLTRRVLGITAPVQGHYAENDGFYPVDQAHAQEDQIRSESAGSVEFFYYPAGHAFHNDKDRLGTYNQELASLAWSRAVAFLTDNAH